MTTPHPDTSPESALICAAVAAPTVDQALAAARQAARQADLVEIRLDALSRPDPAPFLELPIPLLFTNRPTWEGGGFAGPEPARLQPLLAAVAGGCAMVDLELKAPADLRRELRAATATAPAKLILSWHDFADTPDRQTLADIVRSQQQAGADIGKVVTMAHDFQDVLRVLDLQTLAAEIGLPLIAFCMGKAGMISRLATLKLGGFMTYAAPDQEPGTAPGQLSVSTLNAILRMLDHDHH